MRDLLELIGEALEQRRWSARQASIEAVGSAHLISRMRRGQEPSVSRLRALCEVLGLEFYVGPRRSLGGVDLNVGRLALALEAVTAGFPDAERRLPLHDRAQLDLVHRRNLPGFLVSILFVRKESRLYQGGWCTPRLFVLDFIVVLRIYFSRSPGPLGLVRCSLGVFPVRRDAPQGHARGCPRAVVAPRPLHCLGVLRPGFRPDTERAPRHTACGPGRLRTGQPPASFYESLKPSTAMGRLLWHRLGAKTIELIHENVHVDAVRDDLDTLVLDAELLEAPLGGPDPEKKATEISVKLTGRLRKHAGNPKFKALAERLEELKKRHEQGLLLSIEFLKELLELAKDVVKTERETPIEEDFVCVGRDPCRNAVVAQISAAMSPRPIIASE